MFSSGYPVAGKDVEFVLANAWQTEHLPGRKLANRKQLCLQAGPLIRGGGRSVDQCQLERSFTIFIIGDGNIKRVCTGKGLAEC